MRCLVAHPDHPVWAAAGLRADKDMSGTQTQSLVIDAPPARLRSFGLLPRLGLFNPSLGNLTGAGTFPRRCPDHGHLHAPQCA